jgi:hypothetical protein
MPGPAEPGVTALAHQVGAKALGWLHAHQEHGTLAPSADLGDPDGVYKPLGENALAASLVLRESVAGSGELRKARDLLDFTWRQFRDGDLLYERLLRHPLMHDPLETYAPLVRSGYRHARLDRLFQHTTRLRSVRAVEQLPNRRLASANAARVAGFDGGPGQAWDWPALISETWLARRPEPWLIDWLTAYSVTHTVFHVTDWGGRPDGLPGPIARYLARWLPVWIDVWAEIAQWDLVTELMIVGSCLPEPYVSAADWQRLAAVQHEDGLVPRDAEPPADDPATRYRDQQHTAVVALVAATLAVSRTLTVGEGEGVGASG